MDTTVYLIRHSMKMERTKNHWPGYDRIQPLSVEGERRAQALADVEELRGADAAYSSPFARTISTLRYITEADGLLPYLDDRLSELEFGAMFPPGWQPPGPGGGPPPGDDIRARQWIDRDLAAPEGESLNQCCRRMTEAISEFVRENPGKKILVASHGAAIGSYLSSIIEGIDDDYTRHLPQPAVFRMIFRDEQAVSVERIL